MITMNNLQEQFKLTLEELRAENQRLARLVTELIMKNEHLRSKLADQTSTSQSLVPAQRIP
jgi:regulator of replication initiation timing